MTDTGRERERESCRVSRFKKLKIPFIHQTAIVNFLTHVGRSSSLHIAIRGSERSVGSPGVTQEPS